MILKLNIRANLYYKGNLKQCMVVIKVTLRTSKVTQWIQENIKFNVEKFQKTLTLIVNLEMATVSALLIMTNLYT